MRDPSFTLGIEEEYLLVDRRSRDLVIDPPAGLMEACEKATDGRVSSEFIRSQLEVATGVCRSVQQAATEMQELRRTLGKVVAEFGLGILAASSHPFAKVEQQLPTAKERYAGIARDLQGIGRHLVVSGMHVHAGLDDDDLRIDLMSQVAYFTPHLLALSTSSPFWDGQDTGLKSYRLAVYNEVPRSGTPDIFESWSDYQRHVDILVRAGVIEDGTKIWWDLRPSARFPTLELRIPDLCTTLADGISIAALYLCLLHRLWRLKRANQRWRRYAAMLVRENRWRAQRYGTDEGLIDFGKGQIVPFATLLEELIDLTEHDAAVLGCVDEVLWSREILRRGTSAHRQLAVYRQALDGGADKAEALRHVVDFLLEETLAGT